jgi:DNA polymerase III delta prime subunit
MAVPATTRGNGNGHAPAPPAPKLTLSRVSSGRVEHSPWLHVYGPEGVGKSSLGAGAPAPIFIDVEQGTLNLETTRFVFDGAGRTMPASYEEFLEAVRTIEREAHPYKTLVIDTLDAVEGLIWRHICERDNKENIAAYGYGKGENIVALDEWRKLIAALERVRAKGIAVLTLSHSIVKRFDDPESDGWDRYILKLHEKAGGLVKERADAVLFAKFEVLKTKSKDDRKKIRAVTTDARFLYTKKTGAYDAKNRYDLPEELPLDWSELWSAIQAHRPADPADLAAAVKQKAEKLEAELAKKVLAWLGDAGGDAVKLSKLNTYVNAKLAEAGQEDD